MSKEGEESQPVYTRTVLHYHFSNSKIIPCGTVLLTPPSTDESNVSVSIGNAGELSASSGFYAKKEDKKMKPFFFCYQ